jgi:hypothetical protein
MGCRLCGQRGVFLDVFKSFCSCRASYVCGPFLYANTRGKRDNEMRLGSSDSDFLQARWMVVAAAFRTRVRLVVTIM